MKTMTALSFWQPYAWLIVSGHADVDSRLWSPPTQRIGQTIAVHAAKRKVTRAEYDDFVASMKTLGIKNYPESIDDFEYGKVLGTVVVSKVSKNSKSHWAAPGYFHWHLAAAEQLSPFAVKGQRGWFSVTLP